MDDSVRDVIVLLTSYWTGSADLDARTRNYCRRLAELALQRLPESLIHEPHRHVEELAQVLDQLIRTDPNGRELINALLVTIRPAPTRSQSVHVSGHHNQVISIGGNLEGSILQNPGNPFPESMPAIRSQAGSLKSAASAFSTDEAGFEDQVFVSYAWGGESESIVDELEQALSGRGIRMVRDKKDLGYKGSIEEFEQRIGRGKCVVLVVSDKYLRSEHCMYELVKVAENRLLAERIFPIVLRDARISRALDRLTYIKYWDGKIEELNQAIKEIGVMTDLGNITADLNRYARIRRDFDQLVDLLSDMNTLTPELHAAHGFSTLIGAVEQALRDE